MNNTLLDLSALRFLIVDDSAEMRVLLTHMLTPLGARNFIEANDASEGLEILQVNHVDVIITDWKMEPVDGIVFTRLVRTAPESQFQMIPIIMISGYTEMHHISEARNAGVTEFLAKPVAAKELYRRIEEVILRPPNSFARKHLPDPTATGTVAKITTDRGAAKKIKLDRGMTLATVTNQKPARRSDARN